ncbi:M15 family metallopeptidase, partial [Proteus penneri]
WSYFKKVADAMMQAAKELSVDIEWGGNWKTFKDGPHFQLTHKAYPA